MKKATHKTRAKIGVGQAGIKAAIGKLRKQYGPMLKRLSSSAVESCRRSAREQLIDQSRVSGDRVKRIG